MLIPLRILLFSPMFMSTSAFSVPYSSQYADYLISRSEDPSDDITNTKPIDIQVFDVSGTTDYGYDIYSDYAFAVDKNPANQQSIFVDVEDYVNQPRPSFPHPEVHYQEGHVRLTSVHLPEPGSILLSLIGSLALLLSRRIRGGK